MSKSWSYSALLAIALSACTTAAENTVPEEEPAVSSGFAQTVKDTVIGVCKDALGAVVAPLEDLNLKRQSIPEALQGCAQNPYAMPLPPLCINVQTELAALGKVLGPDIEPMPLPWLPQAGVNKNYVGQGFEQGTNLARQHAVGLVRGKTDVIPFRGVVRKITGAEKHAKAVADAYEAGKLRRAFLKGLQKTACFPSDAPAL